MNYEIYYTAACCFVRHKQYRCSRVIVLIISGRTFFTQKPKIEEEVVQVLMQHLCKRKIVTLYTKVVVNTKPFLYDRACYTQYPQRE